MPGIIRTLKVKIILKEYVPIGELKDYIRSAIGHWGEQLCPDDPLFSIGKENVSVSSMPRVRKEKKHDTSKE